MAMTQLQLDFDKALTEFRTASDNLKRAAEALALEDRKAASTGMTASRKYFNRMVRTYAYNNCGGNFSAAYSRVYHLLASRCNWHPLCVVEKTKGALLDMVESEGMLPQAIDCARQLLVA
jgi:glucose-6-phosphate isomerase